MWARSIVAGARNIYFPASPQMRLQWWRLFGYFSQADRLLDSAQ